jgi:hypothetical protein
VFWFAVWPDEEDDAETRTTTARTGDAWTLDLVDNFILVAEIKSCQMKRQRSGFYNYFVVGDKINLDCL